jgi:protein pelota
MALVEELFCEIAKDNLASYGMKDVRGAADAGAVRKLLVSDALLFKKRDDNTFAELDRMMRSVEQAKGEVFLINSEHDGGKQLDGIGGVGAILRYKVRY